MIVFFGYVIVVGSWIGEEDLGIRESKEGRNKVC